MSKSPVMNVEDADLMDFGIGGRFKARIGSLSTPLGTDKLGYNYVRLEPGKTPFPYHFHHVIEEMFVVLEGTGKVRYGGEEYPLRAGDVVCCPPGEDSAHQVINDSDAELRYLAISTKEPADVVQYPDTGKIAVFVAPPPGSDDPSPALRMIVPGDAGVGYWEGEEQ